MSEEQGGVLPPDNITKIYMEIEKRVNDFATGLIEYLPKDEDSSLDIRFVIDAALKVKEPAKFLVNNYLARKGELNVKD